MIDDEVMERMRGMRNALDDCRMKLIAVVASHDADEDDIEGWGASLRDAYQELIEAHVALTTFVETVKNFDVSQKPTRFAPIKNSDVSPTPVRQGKP